MADAIVLAVYIPPQEPGPGIAHSSIFNNSSLDIVLFEYEPTASKTETTSTGFFL